MYIAYTSEAFRQMMAQGALLKLMWGGGDSATPRPGGPLPESGVHGPHPSPENGGEHQRGEKASMSGQGC